MQPQNSEPRSFALTLFLDSLKNAKLSDRTTKAYATDIRKFIQHLHMTPDSVDASTLAKVEVEQIESYLRASAARYHKFLTLKRNISAIRRFFTFLMEQGLVNSNPANTLSVKSVATKPLTSEQVRSLFAYLSQRIKEGNDAEVARYRRDEVILYLMIFHGLRQYEFRNLKLSQLRRTGNYVSLLINKGRAIQLERHVLQRLRAYLALRNSSSSSIFIRPLSKRRIDHVAISALFVELSYVTKAPCTPKSVHDTHLRLAQNPAERQQLLELLFSTTIQESQAASSTEN